MDAYTWKGGNLDSRAVPVIGWGHRLLVRLLLLTGPLQIPMLTAGLLFLGVRRTRIGASVERGAAAKLLMLPKDMFNEDMEASFGQSSDVSVYSLHRQLVKAVGRRYLPAHVDDNNYVGLSQEDESAKARYRGYWVRVWRWIDRWAGFDAVLTGNFGYYAERELGAALESLGTPFIAIHKECVRSPGYTRFFARIYREHRGPFTGRRILCYNNSERALEIDSGVVAAERVTVTGMPRMDRVHRLRLRAEGRVREGRPRVLFFSFGAKATLPVIIRKMSAPPFTRYAQALEPDLESLRWSQLHEDTHKAMLRLALADPDVDVVIKTKGVEGEREEQLMRRILGVERLPENLQVRYGGDPHDLMLGSDVVCGFNSTALFEAIAADVPVVVPRFGEAAASQMHDYLIDYEDAAEYAHDVDDLIARLLRRARERRRPRRDLPESSRRVLRRWVHNDDGLAGERVREAVLAEIAKARAPEEES